MVRLKLELEDKKRAVSMLQTALVREKAPDLSRWRLLVLRTAVDDRGSLCPPGPAEGADIKT